MRIPRSSIFLLTILSSACNTSETRCFSGDPNLPPIIEPVYRDVDLQMKPITEGGRVPLILPPQGGKVMIVGVRAKNLDGCPVTIATSIRDVCDQSIVALERRPVTLEPKEDGWLEPLLPAEIINYSNLPACPRANLSRDVHGQPYRLTIRVEDKDGRMAEAAMDVVPYCLEPEFKDRCECECTAAYRLGDECLGGDVGTSTTTSTSTGCPEMDAG